MLEKTPLRLMHLYHFPFAITRPLVQCQLVASSITTFYGQKSMLSTIKSSKY